jgi:hypothetical protein
MYPELNEMIIVSYTTSLYVDEGEWTNGGRIVDRDGYF